MSVQWQLNEMSDHKQWVLQHPLFQAVVVPEWGGLVSSLIHQPSQEQLLRPVMSRALWQEHQVVNGIPILFPCGRIRGGEFLWNARHFVWPRTDSKGPNALHGFVWDVPWRVCELPGEALTIAPGVIGQERLERYLGEPIDLRVRYQVVDDKFTITSTVRNQGKNPIPWGLGFHTTMSLAAHDWIVKIPLGREWEMGADLMPTGHLLPKPDTLAGLVEGRSAKSLVADTCYLLDRDETPWIACYHPEKSVRVLWEASPEYRHLVIYRPNLDADFISIEPYTWTHNAPNLRLDPALTGLDGLEPQATRTLKYSVRVDGS